MSGFESFISRFDTVRKPLEEDIKKDTVYVYGVSNIMRLGQEVFTVDLRRHLQLKLKGSRISPDLQAAEYHQTYLYRDQKRKRRQSYVSPE